MKRWQVFALITMFSASMAGVGVIYGKSSGALIWLLATLIWAWNTRVALRKAKRERRYRDI